MTDIEINYTSGTTLIKSQFSGWSAEIQAGILLQGIRDTQRWWSRLPISALESVWINGELATPEEIQMLMGG